MKGLLQLPQSRHQANRPAPRRKVFRTNADGHLATRFFPQENDMAWSGTPSSPLPGNAGIPDFGRTAQSSKAGWNPEWA